MSNTGISVINTFTQYLKIALILIFLLLSLQLNIIPIKNSTQITIEPFFMKSTNNNISLDVGESYVLDIATNYSFHNIEYEISNNDVLDIKKINKTTFEITGITDGHTDVIFSDINSNDLIVNIHVNEHKEKINYVENLITSAFNELGYTEKASNKSLSSKTENKGSKNFTKYGKWYGINPGKWCAMFVSWCANEANINNSLIPSFASVSIGMDWFIENDLFKYKESYTPKPGDIIFFKNNGASHTGIVIGSDGRNVYTIEGNTSNKVGKRYYSLNYNKITGYGTPDYPSYYSFNYNFDYSDAINGQSNSTT